MIKGSKPLENVQVDLVHGHKGKNNNWPGCTKEFVK